MAKILLDTEAKTKSYYFSVMVKGKRVKRRGFKTKAKAQEALDEIRNQLTQGTYITPTTTTFGEYFSEWLSDREADRSLAKSSIAMYKSYYKNHIYPAIGKVPLSELSTKHIKDFIKALRKKKVSNGENMLSDEMVKRIYSVVNTSLNAAVEDEILRKNVADNIKDKPQVNRQERKIWSNESVIHVLNNSRGSSRYWIAVFLAVMTGMRQGEILGLKWSDIDFDKGTLSVKRSLRKNKTEFTIPKTTKSKRIIALSPLTIDVLKEHKEIQELEKASKENYKDDDLVVCSSKGTPARASKVIYAWYTMSDKYRPAHEQPMTFHDLRHISASIMLNDGIDIRIVSQRLGHSTVGTTLNVYSHLMPNAQEKAAQSLDKLIASNVIKP